MKLRLSSHNRLAGSLSALLACSIGLLAALGADQARAEVKLPAIFGDHMVLQRDLTVPIWGTAAPGEHISVTAGSDTANAVAGPDGQWKVSLAKLAASSQPIEVTIKGTNTITFHDVLVGDVWICSGQSNMELGIKAVTTKEELDQAGNPLIRLFTVPKCIAPAPARDIADAPKDFPLIGKWVVCTPDSLAKAGEWSGFSGTGYYFGSALQKFTQQPVGLIESCWGGTRIHSWTSLQTLKAFPTMASFAAAAQKFQDHSQELEQNYLNVEVPKYQADLAKWQADNKDAIDKFNADLAQWEEQAKQAKLEKKPGPPKPKGPVGPKEPRDPMKNNQSSAALYNGMIAPLIPFGIKGAVWYQGESDADNPPSYKIALPALISDWRTQWNQGDFSFLIVQLPNYNAKQPQPGESAWAGLRASQAAALSTPNTGLAVTIDLAAGGNLHPGDKLDVGARLALAAQRVAYGKQDAVTSGPVFNNFKVEGNKVRVSFDNIGGGLIIGNPPDHFFTNQRKEVPKAPPTELTGFAIAGADQKFVWAQASIDGNTVLVSSDAVPNPVAVRYGWADNPDCDLYNKEGLPAMPFRSDNFKPEAKH